MTAAQQTHHVFAYGSNMHLPDVHRWFEEHGFPTPRVHRCTIGVLMNYRLAWNYRSRARAAGAANIWPENGKKVLGVILEVDHQTFAGLDAKEGHPERYTRGATRETLVALDGQNYSAYRRIEAWVYRVTPGLLCPEPVWPTRDYLGLVLEGAKNQNLPQWYQDHLGNIPTID